MGRKSPRIAKTDSDVLLGNLRCEVGEAITTWFILRYLKGEISKLRSNDPREELGNQPLMFLFVLADKLSNELIARLSELGDERIGRTNFYFASRKLQAFAYEVSEFSRFVVAKKFTLKRNQEIAHREQPEQWFEDQPITILYPTLVKGTAMALQLMKKIDRAVLGPAAPFLWHMARKRRGMLMAPTRAIYLLLPHVQLSIEDRMKIAAIEEFERGQDGSAET